METMGGIKNSAAASGKMSNMRSVVLDHMKPIVIG